MCAVVGLTRESVRARRRCRAGLRCSDSNLSAAPRPLPHFILLLSSTPPFYSPPPPPPSTHHVLQASGQHRRISHRTERAAVPSTTPAPESSDLAACGTASAQRWTQRIDAAESQQHGETHGSPVLGLLRWLKLRLKSSLPPVPRARLSDALPLCACAAVPLRSSVWAAPPALSVCS